MSTILDDAEALAQSVVDALDPLDLDVFVTIDPVGIKPSTRAAVVILPPDITFTTWSERDSTFKLAVVAGPPNNPLHALGILDRILDQLEAGGLNLKSATPASYDVAGGANLPTYEVTLNPT